MKKTIKSIQTEMADLDMQYAVELERFQRAQASLAEINKKKTLLSKEMKKLTATLTVSEHAIIRYIERVIGIQRDDIAGKILTPEIQQIHKEMGNGKFPIEDGKARVVIKDNVIVTIES